jgi:hypothetical protein
MKSSHNRTWTWIFSLHNQWCMWVDFLSTFECEFLLLAMCSVSPVLQGQFVQTLSLCRANSDEVWFIYWQEHSCYSWNLTLKTIEIILTDIKNEYTYSGYVWENDVLWSIVTVCIQWICVREWRIVKYCNSIHCTSASQTQNCKPCKLGTCFVYNFVVLCILWC